MSLSIGSGYDQKPPRGWRGGRERLGAAPSRRVGDSARLSNSVGGDMHEYSLVRALLDRVDRSAREHGASQVSALRVRVGEVAGVDMELLASAFDLARAGTSAASAELELVGEPARWECASCKVEVPRGAVLRCPACGDPARLTGGDEILLERIEMEVPDHV